jgi:membrane-associated phospholipid phosphatase
MPSTGHDRTLFVITTLSLCALLGGAAAWAQEPPVSEAAPTPGQIPMRVLGDVRRLTRGQPLVELGIGAGLALAVHPQDRSAVRALSANHGAEETLDAGAGIGDGFVQVGGAAVVYGVGEWLHRPAAASLGADLVEAQAVAGMLTQGLKVSVHRVRPDGGNFSFPSGHSSAAFATATVLRQRFGWPLGAAAYAGATYVALSRMSERRHYFSDVLTGAAIGIASGQALGNATQGRRLAIAGMPTAKGFQASGVLRLGR